MFDGDDTDAVAGAVHWQPAKSLWISTMTASALIGGPLFFTWDAFVLFLATTAATLCLGHSLGMHRRLIHRAFDCPVWLERLFVYLGTLVGMAGPYGMIRQHDIRDWAQRRAQCHPYLAHRSAIVRDAFWQLHCELVLAHPPRLIMERRVADTGFISSSSARGWRSSSRGPACFSCSVVGRGWFGVSPCAWRFA
jgi:stearoyl-CoA desaturase (delta-9 desaturase)